MNPVIGRRVPHTVIFPFRTILILSLTSLTTSLFTGIILCLLVDAFFFIMKKCLPPDSVSYTASALRLVFSVVSLSCSKFNLTDGSACYSSHHRDLYPDMEPQNEQTTAPGLSVATRRSVTSVTTVTVCTESRPKTSLALSGEARTDADDALDDASTPTASAPTYTSTSASTPVVENAGTTIVSRTEKIFTSRIITNIDTAPVVKYTASTEMASPATTPADTVVSDPFSPISESSFTSASSATPTPKPLRSILRNGPKQLVDEDAQDELTDSDDESDEDGDEDISDNEDEDSDEEDESEDESEEESEEESDNDDYYDDGEYESDNEGISHSFPCSTVEKTQLINVDLNAAFSFVSFGNNVHFSEEVSILSIESRRVENHPHDTMTAHEKMVLCRDSRSVGLNGKSNDCEEHGRDTIDIDQELLMAYLNGLKTVSLRDSRIVIRARIVKPEQAEEEAHDDDYISLENYKPIHEYLDRIEETVIGMFPYLLSDEEYRGLLKEVKLAVYRPDPGSFTFLTEYDEIRERISCLLTEKLAADADFFGPDMGTWLAGELLEPLARHAHRDAR